MDPQHVACGELCKIISATSVSDHVLIELSIPYCKDGVVFTRTIIRNDQLEQIEIKTKSHCITKSKIIVINSIEDLLK